MSQQLREQTEECHRLETALHEMSVCLAKALRLLVTADTRLEGMHCCIGSESPLWICHEGKGWMCQVRTGRGESIA